MFSYSCKDIIDKVKLAYIVHKLCHVWHVGRTKVLRQRLSGQKFLSRNVQQWESKPPLHLKELMEAAFNGIQIKFENSQIDFLRLHTYMAQ